MSRVISLRISDEEDIHLQGGAAILGLSVPAYLKWFISNGKLGSQTDTDLILRRIDELESSIGKSMNEEEVARAPLSTVAKRSLLVSKLKSRGIPTSTIRQIEIVLDEIENQGNEEVTDVNVNIKNPF